MENKMPNLNNIFKSEERNISLALQRYSTVGKDSYKLLCESAYKDFSDKEVVRSVAQLFKNKVSVIEGSIKRLPSNLVSFIVRENKRSFAYDGKTLPSKFKKITASIIADTEDNSIWEVVSEGGKKRIVLKSNEHFEDLFKHNNRICTAAVHNYSVPAQLGDYVAYYDNKSHSVKAGYVTEVKEDPEFEDQKLFLITDENMNDTMVNEELIMDAADLTDLGKNPVALAALDEKGADDVKDYMKELFNDTEFYDNLKDLIGARRKLGTDGEYENTIVASTEEEIQKAKDVIKDYVFNEALNELKQEIGAPSEVESNEEEVIEEEANADGDLDFASEEEMNDFLAAEKEEEEVSEPVMEDEESLEEGLEIPAEEEEPVMEDISVEDQTLDEDIAEASEEELGLEDRLSGLLSEDDIEVTSEEELDEGEFEDFPVEEEIKE